MALRAVPDHPKFAALKAALRQPKGPVMGWLEAIWHFTGRFTPQGDIGKYPDEAIEGWVEWDGESGKLVETLVRTGWLDRDSVYRLVVHDWAQHADKATKNAINRAKLNFCTPTVHTPYVQCTDESLESGTAYRLPEPVPEPVPEPGPGERPPTPQNTETAAVARKALPVALTPMIDRIDQPYAQEPHQHGIAPQEEAQYDPSADPLENIPEGLALLQYAGFVAEQVGIPAGYALKVKIGDTLSIMASGGLMATAVRGLIERMKAAGPQKWLFWLEDGGWKDDAGSNATEAAFLGGSA